MVDAAVSGDRKVQGPVGARMIERDFAARATVRTMVEDSRYGPARAELVDRRRRLAADGKGEADGAALISLLVAPDDSSGHG